MQAEQKTGVVGKKCEACGSEMVFDPTSQGLVCRHCGNTAAIEDACTIVAERDFVLTAADAEPWRDGKSYRCENCGATTVLTENEIATECPFCGAPKVVELDDQPGVKPMGILPFSITKESAFESLKKFIKRKLFAPSKFKKAFTPDKAKGIYVPCFLYDTYSVTHYSGRFGQYYTVTVGSGKNRRTERRIRWHYGSGTLEHAFNDYAIEASSKLDQPTFEKIAPFATEEPRKYAPEYMLGYAAERYDDGPDKCFQYACDGMRDIIKSLITDKECADLVDGLQMDVVHHDVKYKYLLLPVWTCSETYKGKQYGYVINGQTGKSAGKAPISPIRATIAAILGSALVVAILYLITQS